MEGLGLMLSIGAATSSPAVVRRTTLMSRSAAISPSGWLGLSLATFPAFTEEVNRQAIRIADAETAMAPSLVL